MKKHRCTAHIEYDFFVDANNTGEARDEAIITLSDDIAKGIIPINHYELADGVPPLLLGVRVEDDEGKMTPEEAIHILRQIHIVNDAGKCNYSLGAALTMACELLKTRCILERTGYTLHELEALARAKREGRFAVLPDGEDLIRCEDCVHGGWTDDVTTHCNKWHTKDDPMCVGYLGFCGAGEKGKQLELIDAEAALKKGDE